MRALAAYWLFVAVVVSASAAAGGASAGILPAGEAANTAPGDPTGNSAAACAAPNAAPRWWRVSGHLHAGDRWFGVYAIFYEYGTPGGDRFVTSGFELVDLSTRRTVTATRLDRCGGGLASDDSARDVRVDGWRFREALGSERRGQTFSLTLADDRSSLALDQRALKAPVAGAGSTSFTRLAARGNLVFDGTPYAVTGTTWIDRVEGGRSSGPPARRNRFEVQFDNGRELMLEVVRKPDGSAAPESSGFLVARDGSVTRLRRDEFWADNTLGTSFTSPHTGLRYPSLWVIFVPGVRLDSIVVPSVQDQEIIRSGGAAFWAGTADVEHRPPPGGDPGRAYVESTGYDLP
jgi:predicted secreted hydrolase